MFHSSSARWLAVFPAMVALAAVAQPAPTPPPAPTSAGSAATAAPLPVLTFKSALEGYQSFADEKPILLSDILIWPPAVARADFLAKTGKWTGVVNP